MTVIKITAIVSVSILTIASVFAATKKPDSIISIIFYTIAGGCRSFVVTFNGVLFTTGGSGLQSTIKTVGGDHRKLWGHCVLGIATHPAHAHF